MPGAPRPAELRIVMGGVKDDEGWPRESGGQRIAIRTLTARWIATLRTIDPAGRHERWQEIETILKADVPHIFLVWAPLVVIARASPVHGLESHPNNESFVHGRLSAAQPT